MRINSVLCRSVIALFLFTSCSFATVVKPPPVSSKEKKKPQVKRFEVTVYFRNLIEHIPVFLKIYDESGKDVLNPVDGLRFLADGKATFRLPKGKYQLIVDAGPRYNLWKGLLNIGNEETYREVTLEKFLPVNKKEWITFDPLVTPHSLYQPQIYLSSLLLKMQAADVDMSAVSKQVVTDDDKFEESGDIEKAYEKIFFTKKIFDDRFTILSSNSDSLYYKFEKISNYKKSKETIVYWSSTETDKEFLKLIATGILPDGINIARSKLNQKIWLSLLDLGFKIPAFGCTTYQNDLENIYPQTQMFCKRTEVNNKSAVLSALKKGASIISNGPFVSFEIDGKTCGDSILASDISRQVKILAYSTSAHTDSIKSIDIIYNNEIIESFKGLDAQRTLDAGCSAVFSEPGWVMVRYRGRDEKYYAITNPLYIDSGGFRKVLDHNTSFTIKAMQNIKPSPCIIEVWDNSTFLGRFTIPKKGKKLTFPATSVVKVFNLDGSLINQFSLFKASGAERYLDRLADDKEELTKALTTKNGYLKLIEILKDADIVVDLQ